MMPWLVYALLVSGLVSVAAWLAESGARAQRWPTRWVWTGALAVSVVAPIVAWMAPEPASAPLAAAPAGFVLESLPTLSSTGAGEAGVGLERMALIGWGVTSGLLVLMLIVMTVQLRVRGRGWPRRVVEGVEVLVSRNIGPAAMGVLRGRVIVPEWSLELDPGQQKLLILHEAEHVRSRDPLLAVIGLVVCALAPWNLPLWWQLRRLRLAIEIDCDARVLRRTVDPRDYGALLLAVGERKGQPAFALALAEPTTMLERRIRMIMKTTMGRATIRAAMLATLSGAVLVMACEAPAPTEANGEAVAEEPQVLSAEAGSEASDWILGLRDGACAVVLVDGERSSVEAFRAMDPEEIRRIEVVKGDAVPESLRTEAGCGLIHVSTMAGSPEERMEFEHKRRPAASPQVETERSELESKREGMAAEPTFTPMTQAPRLRHPREVASRLQELYPPVLRDAGVGGTTNVWFYIDETGSVAETRVNQSSGYEALDQAALAVAREMEFEPALNKEERVPVWVALDLKFEAK